MSDPCVPAVVAAEAALVKQNYALIFVGEQSRSSSNAPLLMFVQTSYLHRPDPIRHRDCSGSSCSTQRATQQPVPYLTPLGLHLLQSLPAVSSNVCTCIRPWLKCSYRSLVGEDLRGCSLLLRRLQRHIHYMLVRAVHTALHVGFNSYRCFSSQDVLPLRLALGQYSGLLKAYME